MMNLVELGLNDSLASEARACCGPDLALARVTAVDRDRYLIRHKTAEVPAELNGKFKHLTQSSDKLPCVSDWVGVHYRDAGTQANRSLTNKMIADPVFPAIKNVAI